MSKVLFVGLDGATFSLLLPLIDEGCMPFLGKLISEGFSSDLLSTPVPLTPPGWISTVTGMMPENHGIFDFLRPQYTPNGVILKVNDSRDLRAKTLWSYVSQQGKRITSLNFYGMSPPPPVDGYLISGFIPWKHLRSATYPSSFFDTLKSLPNVNLRKLGMDIGEEKKCIQGLPESEYEEWIDLQATRDLAWTNLLKYLIETDPTELTSIVYDGTDKIQHLFWRYLDPKYVKATLTSAWHQHIRDMCIQYYTQVDQSLRELYEASGPGTSMVITSDHGFGATDEVVYINEFLHRNGYLSWSDDTVLQDNTKLTADRIKDHTLMIDWTKTLAYSLTPSSNAIYINRKSDDNPHGVPDKDYNSFCLELQQKLLSYQHGNDCTPVFTKVELNQRRLSGTSDFEHAPDIILGLRDGGFVSILRSSEVVRKRQLIDGTHRPNGIFIGHGPMFKQKKLAEPLSIYDVTPIILYLLKLQIPAGLDGKVPTEIFDDTYLTANPVITSPTLDTRPIDSDSTKEITDEEKESLMAQLRLLGYVD